VDPRARGYLDRDGADAHGRNGLRKGARSRRAPGTAHALAPAERPLRQRSFMSLLRCLPLLGLVLAAACAAPVDGAGDDGEVSETDEALSTAQTDQRADLATQRLIDRFWSKSHDSFAGAFPSDGKNAGYWIYAQAFDAVLDGVERTKGAKWKGEIARLFDAQDRRGFEVGFFDDENWMALALLRAHRLTGEPRYLAKSEELMRDIMHQGWDGHGVWWDRVHSQRATASNFGPVITAARLYGQTHEIAYRTFAEKVYANWYPKMVNPTTHQVADHVSPAGKVAWWKFTYNEGLAIGASTALFEMTHDATYLQHAHEVAGFMVQHETTSAAGWKILFDGDGCNGDCDAFKGIGYRYLLGLYEIDKTHAEYAAILKDSAEAIWRYARTPASTTFSSGWNAAGHRTTSLAADASATMALNLAVAVEH
jgi:predicted alpha-1,6-mannanase (GH76 family)